MGSTPGQEYAYAYGRLGVLRQRLPEQSDIDRLVSAPDMESMKNVLREMRFTAEVMTSVNDIHDVIPALERQLRRDVESMVPQERRELFEILWLKEDGALLAYLLKKHHTFTSSLSRMPRSSISAHDTDALVALVERDDQGQLPPHLVRFVHQVKALTNATPAIIDTMVAQYVAHRQVELAEQSRSEHIHQYVAHQIDLQNIRTAKRLEGAENPRAHFLEGGEINPRDFTGERGHLSAVVRGSSLPDSLADAIEKEDDTAVTLERGLARGIAHAVAEMGTMPLTIEPVFAYAVMALSQLRLLRTVLIAKTTGLSPEETLHMLPPFLSTTPYAA